MSNAGNIGAGVTIRGRVHGALSLQVAGRIEGEVSLDGALTVLSGGEVTADVSASEVVVQGTLTGNVTSTERVRIEAGGRLIGDVRTPRLSVAEGATLRGAIDMDLS